LDLRHRKLRAAFAAGAAAGALLAGGSAAHASGFAVTGVTVEGLGRANSGEAADTGAGALWWNPAAIARSGGEVSLGLSHRMQSNTLENAGTSVTRPIPPVGLTTPVGGASRIEDVAEDFTAPYLAVALPLGDRAAVGLSVSKPFHIRNELGATTWTRYDTVRNKISVTDVQLTGALQLSEWLDLGLGVSGQHNKSFLDQAYPNLDPTAPDGLSQLQGDGWNFGWTAGVQAHLSQLTLGFSYRSAVEQEIEGSLTVSGLLGPLATSNFSAPAKTTFTTRSTATLAARWAVTPELTLNGQVVRSGWDEYDKITVDFAGQTATIPQRFKNTTSVAAGFDYALNPMWTVRAGVQYDPTPTPDDLREPGVFDSDRWIMALGASAQVGSQVTVHGALAFTRFKDTDLQEFDTFYGGTLAQTTVPVRGRFEGDEVTAAIGADWAF
jgi:long-chain fatty acid transport protein